MGKRATQPPKSKLVVLPEDLHYKLKNAATADRVTITEIISKLVRDWLRKRGE